MKDRFSEFVLVLRRSRGRRLSRSGETHLAGVYTALHRSHVDRRVGNDTEVLKILFSCSCIFYLRKETNKKKPQTQTLMLKRTRKFLPASSRNSSGQLMPRIAVQTNF